nr:MAG TPA: hypothetical protein [Caudoviricetes sp.]
MPTVAERLLPFLMIRQIMSASFFFNCLLLS